MRRFVLVLGLLLGGCDVCRELARANVYQDCILAGGTEAQCTAQADAYDATHAWETVCS